MILMTVYVWMQIRIFGKEMYLPCCTLAEDLSEPE